MLRYSILPAISLDGVLHLDILTQSWTADEFSPFIEVLLGQMNPYPQNNVEGQGMHLCYLPPYSPNFNPIEQGFSAMKAWIQRNNDFVIGELTRDETCDPFAIIWKAVFDSMTPENIEGWYRDSGYIV